MYESMDGCAPDTTDEDIYVGMQVCKYTLRYTGWAKRSPDTDILLHMYGASTGLRWATKNRRIKQLKRWGQTPT